jgi:hypothetical protein
VVSTLPLDPCQLLALRGAPGPRRCCRSEPRQEPARTQTRLGPSPFRGDLAQNGAPPGPPRREQKSARDLVLGALTEVTAGGSSAPTSWWDGTNRQVAPRRPRGGGRILFTCTCLFAVGRSCWPGRCQWRQVPGGCSSGHRATRAMRNTGWVQRPQCCTRIGPGMGPPAEGLKALQQLGCVTHCVY